MSNPSKVKGSNYEREIVNYLRQHFADVDRTRAGWTDDRGDIHGIEGFTWECKNHKAMALSQWVAELHAECRNAGTDLGAVVHKKRGTTDPEQQYATLPLGMLVQLLKRAGFQ